MSRGSRPGAGDGLVCKAFLSKRCRCIRGSSFFCNACTVQARCNLNRLLLNGFGGGAPARFAYHAFNVGKSAEVKAAREGRRVGGLLFIPTIHPCNSTESQSFHAEKDKLFFYRALPAKWAMYQPSRRSFLSGWPRFIQPPKLEDGSMLIFKKLAFQ